MVLGSRFGEQVCRIAALGQQLWRIALGHNFGEQRRRTVLGSSIGVQLWTAFQTSWQLRAAATLGSSFPQHVGQQLLRTALGTTLWSSAGEQLWGAALRSSCARQLLRTAALGSIIGDNFGEQLLGVALGQPLCRGALENSFRNLGSN